MQQNGGNMLSQSFYENNIPYIIEYLEQSSSISIVLLDENLVIKDCNKVFLKTIGTSQKPFDTDFFNMILPEDRPVLESAIKNNNPDIHFTLFCNKRSLGNMHGYLARSTDNCYLLFCERTKVTDETIIQEISKLNNQMANITRELNKKNFALEKANAKISELLKIDSLTGIANRQHFIDYYYKMNSYTDRHELPLSLVITDLDHFKQINDRYGHQTGDQVLIQFARLMKENCRKEDLPARYGGEEFIILMINTDSEQAVAQAERIRKELHSLTINDLNLSITASFGVATKRSNETLDELIGRADRALYKAKRAGRNRVHLAQ